MSNSIKKSNLSLYRFFYFVFAAQRCSRIYSPSHDYLLNFFVYFLPLLISLFHLIDLLSFRLFLCDKRRLLFQNSSFSYHNLLNFFSSNLVSIYSSFLFIQFCYLRRFICSIKATTFLHETFASENNMRKMRKKNRNKSI